MSDTTPQPVCTCGHRQSVHSGNTCLGSVACTCHAWTLAPDATTDPFSRGW